jgi:hypothetical protein
VGIVPGLNSHNDVFVGKKKEVHHQLKSRRRQTKIVRARGSKRAPNPSLLGCADHLPFLSRNFCHQQHQSQLRSRQALDHTGCLV